MLVLVLFLGRWQVGRLGQRQLESTTTKLDTDEPGWRLDAILDARKKAEPPAAENAGPVVLKLADDIPEDWRKWRNSDEAAAFWPKRVENRLPPAAAVGRGTESMRRRHTLPIS